jgi:hypothetical protein
MPDSGDWASAVAPATSDSAQTSAPFFNPNIVYSEPSAVGPLPTLSARD